MKHTLSIIIPVFNESESLQEFTKQLHYILKKNLSAYTYEIIYINDGSTDNSLHILQIIYKKYPHIKIVSFRKNLGKSTALNEGFKRATGTIIVTLDADLQDDPINIPLLISTLTSGYDLVVGWRKNRHDRFSKVLLSKLFNFTVGMISHAPLNDFNCGLKVMRKTVAEEIHLYGELHRFIPLLAIKQGFTVTEVPVVHHERRYGSSKYGTSRLLSGFFDFLTVLFLDSFNKRPLHFFGLLGSFEIILGILFGSYLTVLRFSGETIGNRPLLVLTMLLIITGMQLISIGLIAEMIVSRSKPDEKLPIDFQTKHI